jgi:Rad3-related DNA helicase
MDDVRAFFQKLGKVPRDVQLAMCPVIKRAVEHNRTAAFNLPTGVGKQLIALYACHSADSRSAYVCSSKSLQVQVMREARQVGASVFCKFGRSNYLCNKQTRTFIEDGPARHRLTGDQWEAICSFLEASSRVHDCDDEFWTNVDEQMDEWKVVSSQNGLSSEYALGVWNSICGQRCDCKDGPPERMSQCPCYMSTVNAKNSKVLVCNMAYLCACAAHNILDYTLEKRFLVIDEAHLLPGEAQAIYNVFATRHFDAARLERQLRSWEGAGSSPVEGRIDLSLFEEVRGEEALFRTKKRGLLPNLRSLRVNAQLQASAELRAFLLEHEMGAELVVERIQKSKRNGLTYDPVTLRQILCDIRHRVSDLGYAELEQAADSLCQSGDGVREENLFSRIRVLMFARAQPAGESFMEHCRALFGSDITAKSCVKELDTVAKVSDTVRKVKIACSKTTWEDGQWSDREVPVLHKNGVRYDLTVPARAAALKKFLWDRLARRPIFISATMVDETHHMDVFSAELGIPFDIEERVDSVFQQNLKIVIQMPSYPYGNASELPDHTQRRVQESVAALTHHMQQNHKATLIMGTSNAELALVEERLTNTLPSSYTHVPFGDVKKFQDFKRSGSSRYVYVTGTKGLSVGVDLPGRIGLGVSLRLPAEKFEVYMQHSKEQMGRKYWEWYNFKTMQNVLQRIGRVLRRENDTGTFLALGMNSDAQLRFKKICEAHLPRAAVTLYRA